ncbi:MAG: hypothetical protein FWH43_06275 [Endomicrobia bacterium]|nr:hypothetical protein [Endomicrobiia bacterium]
MRRLLAFLVVAVFVAAAASPAFAQFSHVSSSTKTAKVEFTGTGVFAWTVDLFDIAGDAPATEFTWVGGATKPTGWATSTQYAVITTTITQTGAGIQVYTDNQNGTTYQFTGSSTAVANAGLVARTATNNNPLPMAWSMKEVKISTTVVNPISSDDAVKFASCYFKDKNGPSSGDSTKLTNGEAYATILNTGGMKYGGGDGERGGSPSGTFYMYIGADFATASTPMEYGTDTLTFEGYTE